MIPTHGCLAPSCRKMGSVSHGNDPLWPSTPKGLSLLSLRCEDSQGHKQLQSFTLCCMTQIQLPEEGAGAVRKPMPPRSKREGMQTPHGSH